MGSIVAVGSLDFGKTTAILMVDLWLVGVAAWQLMGLQGHWQQSSASSIGLIKLEFDVFGC